MPWSLFCSCFLRLLSYILVLIQKWWKICLLSCINSSSIDMCRCLVFTSSSTSNICLQTPIYASFMFNAFYFSNVFRCFPFSSISTTSIVSVILPYACPVFNTWFEYSELTLVFRGTQQRTRWSTMLQAVRSRLREPPRELNFITSPNPSSRTGP
jgi:hypothetical protein